MYEGLSAARAQPPATKLVFTTTTVILVFTTTSLYYYCCHTRILTCAKVCQLRALSLPPPNPFFETVEWVTYNCHSLTSLRCLSILNPKP